MALLRSKDGRIDDDPSAQPDSKEIQLGKVLDKIVYSPKDTRFRLRGSDLSSSSDGVLGERVHGIGFPTILLSLTQAGVIKTTGRKHAEFDKLTTRLDFPSAEDNVLDVMGQLEVFIQKTFDENIERGGIETSGLQPGGNVDINARNYMADFVGRTLYEYFMEDGDPELSDGRKKAITCSGEIVDHMIDKGLFPVDTEEKRHAVRNFLRDLFDEGLGRFLSTPERTLSWSLYCYFTGEDLPVDIGTGKVGKEPSKA